MNEHEKWEETSLECFGVKDDYLYRASFPKVVDSKESSVLKSLHRETTELHDLES